MIPKYLMISKKIRDLLNDHGSDDCDLCGGEGSLELNYQYKYVTPDGLHTIILPAWECSICMDMQMDEAGLLKLANYFKKPYEQVLLMDSTIVIRSVH